MGKQAKLILLFFIFLLCFGISKEYSRGLQFSQKLTSKTDSSLFVSEPGNQFGLHRANEITLSTVKLATGPASKIFQDCCTGRILSFESRIQNLGLAFLKDARKIQLILSIRTIIFPFHFFW